MPAAAASWQSIVISAHDVRNFPHNDNRVRGQRLVEMAVFRVDPANDDILFVQPRIVARTREVVRAVIEFEGDSKMEVSTPTEEGQGGGNRFTITEGEFYRKLGEENEPVEIEFVKRVLRQARDHHLTVEWKQSGTLLKYFDTKNDVFFTLGGFDCWGSFAHVNRFSDRCEELDLPELIWPDYFDTIVRLIPGASRKPVSRHRFHRPRIDFIAAR